MEKNNDTVYYQELVQRYSDNKASEEELELFFHLLGEGKLDEYLVESMNREAGLEIAGAPVIDINQSRKFSWKKMAAAAAILIFLAGGGYFLFYNNTQKQPPVTGQQQPLKTDLPPGSHKAVLTLANGERIILDSAVNGQLATQGNALVLNKDGKLFYDDNKQQAVNEVLYNTVSTARGETYSLTLADGSQVWLNSASSIRFPVAFPGSERRIEINGEAYFKIAKNPKQPFIVAVNGMQVQALGTEFNINAYSDEAAVLTTLIEGSVKIGLPLTPSGGGETVILKPGQQTQINKQENKIFVNNNVDIARVIAWQKGLFEFNKTDLPSIMRQISRWYDVDIIYEGPVTKETFGGGISRNLPLSNALKLLEANGIQFSLEGKKLFVRS